MKFARTLGIELVSLKQALHDIADIKSFYILRQDPTDRLRNNRLAHQPPKVLAEYGVTRSRFTRMRRGYGSR